MMAEGGHSKAKKKGKLMEALASFVSMFKLCHDQLDIIHFSGCLE